MVALSASFNWYKMRIWRENIIDYVFKYGKRQEIGLEGKQRMYLE